MRRENIPACTCGLLPGAVLQEGTPFEVNAKTGAYSFIAGNCSYLLWCCFGCGGSLFDLPDKASEVPLDEQERLAALTKDIRDRAEAIATLGPPTDVMHTLSYRSLSDSARVIAFVHEEKLLFEASVRKTRPQEEIKRQMERAPAGTCGCLWLPDAVEEASVPLDFGAGEFWIRQGSLEWRIRYCPFCGLPAPSELTPSRYVPYPEEEKLRLNTLLSPMISRTEADRVLGPPDKERITLTYRELSRVATVRGDEIDGVWKGFRTWAKF